MIYTTDFGSSMNTRWYHRDGTREEVRVSRSVIDLHNTKAHNPDYKIYDKEVSDPEIIRIFELIEIVKNL